MLDAALRTYKRGDISLDRKRVAAACANFTGSEIAAIVPDALFAAFADGAREVTAADLLAAANTVVPLATTAKEKITKLREWAATRARPATSQVDAKSTGAPRGRALDI